MQFSAEFFVLIDRKRKPETVSNERTGRVVCGIRGKLSGSEDYSLYLPLLTREDMCAFSVRFIGVLLWGSCLLFACQGNSYDRALALYREGNRLEEQHYPDSAVLAYRTAADLLTGSENYELLSRTYNRLGDLLLVYEVYDRAWEAHAAALEYGSLLEDKSCQSRAYRGLGKNFYLQKDAGRALEYFLQASELEDRVCDREERSSIYNNLSNAYSLLGKYEKALACNTKAIGLTGDSVKIYRNYAVRGRLFTLLQQYDSAYHYLSVASRSKDPRIRASCFYKLSDMPLESGVTDSMKYACLTRARILTDSIEDMGRAVQVTETEHLHLLRQLESKEKNKLAYVVMGSLFLILSTGIYLYRRYRCRVRVHREELNRQFAETEGKTGREQDNDTREKQIISIVSRTGSACLKNFMSLPFYGELKTRLKAETGNLSYTEQDELQRIIFKEFDSYIRQITAIVPLSANDVLLCCLSILGLTTKECAVCRGVSSETIRSQRTRIKKKIPSTFLEHGLFKVLFGEE